MAALAIGCNSNMSSLGDASGLGDID